MLESSFRGNERFFPRGTPNKAAAAAKARDIYLFLTVNGWAQVLRIQSLRSYFPSPKATNAPSPIMPAPETSR
jgi:hypothetical protein